ncbi:Protein of unknown function [Bacillus wiedmannii]|nr:Protein of unknown function [Bacillus wiedmannii]
MSGIIRKQWSYRASYKGT